MKKLADEAFVWVLNQFTLKFEWLYRGDQLLLMTVEFSVHAVAKFGADIAGTACLPVTCTFVKIPVRETEGRCIEGSNGDFFGVLLGLSNLVDVGGRRAWCLPELPMALKARKQLVVQFSW